MRYIKKFTNSNLLDLYKKSKFISPHIFIENTNVEYFEEYKRLEYISSTQTGGQYIDLGCQLLENTDDIQIDIKFNVKNHGKTGQQQSTFISSQPEVDPWPGFTIRIAAANITAINNSVQFTTKWLCSKDWGSYIEGSKTRYGCSYFSPRRTNGTAMITDGTFTEINQIYEYSILLDNIPDSQINNFSCHLFCALDSSNNPFRFIAADLYYLKFTKGDKVIRNLVPVKKSSTNEVGLYDIENNHFYTSQGDDPFVAGPIYEDVLKAADYWYVGKDYPKSPVINPELITNPLTKEIDESEHWQGLNEGWHFINNLNNLKTNDQHLFEEYESGYSYTVDFGWDDVDYYMVVPKDSIFKDSINTTIDFSANKQKIMIIGEKQYDVYKFRNSEFAYLIYP
jgi:hypothetical protein